MKTILIKKNERKRTYLKKLEKIDTIGLDAKKYSGKIKITENPVEIQRKIRNEWK